MDARIVPFSLDHIEGAATLLSLRHRDDRSHLPMLPEEYDDPSATLPVVQDLFDAEGAGGVVALRDGDMVAYLHGTPDYRAPTATFAGFMRPRAMDISYAGFAAGTGAANLYLYHRLYAALSAQWVKAGRTAHYITVPDHAASLETWSNLGFARYVALAVRSTAPVSGRDDCEQEPIEVRRATSEDEPVIHDLITELFRTFAGPPMLVPFLTETAADRERFLSAHMADTACLYWLALLDGRVVGVQVFEEPHSAHWHQSAINTPPRSLYLMFAYTSPEARGKGVGRSLFDQTMSWARGAGYDTCMLYFFTASRAAAFWQGLGFHPVAQWLCRSVDERAIWAHVET